MIAKSVWIDGRGRTVDVDSDDRGHAMDRMGWVNVCATAKCIEFWVNPLSVQERALSSAVELTAGLRTAADDRPVIVKVHDRCSRGSLVADSIDTVSAVVHESVRLTSRPGHPLMQDRLVGCLPTDINDAHVQDLWRFLVATQFRATGELIERVVATEGRAKVVTVNSRGGTVRYLAHDRRTAALWKHPAGFAGRTLDEVPVPEPLKRSVRSDLTGMLRERQIVVSFVRGLRRVMKEDAPMDSFFRISIPLRRQPGSSERAALVLLSPYA